jgi:glycosyltransferase A (GT-A) superfamily protein (DUF2064 family)
MDRLTPPPPTGGCLLSVFAKTPGLTPAKTRLARGIGPAAAEEFFIRSLAATRALVLALAHGPARPGAPHSDGASAGSPAACDWRWALAEASGPAHPFWQGDAAVWTGEGDLGQRLHAIYDQSLQSHGHALIIGSDSPFLPLGHLRLALDRLHRHPGRLVLGPSHDGGFYLIGGSRPIPRHAWTTVTYSQADTRAQLLARLADAGLSVSELPPHGDIDTLDDLRAAARSAQAEERAGAAGQRLPAQTALLDWMGRLPALHPASAKETAT